MKTHKGIAFVLGLVLLLGLAACSGQEAAEESASPSPTPDSTPAAEEETEETAEEETGTLTIGASFQDEAGAALAGATVRFTAGDTQADYLTGEDGALTVAGLPAEGTVEVAVLDEAGAETAGTVLELSEGLVTDVTEGEDGGYSVTLLTGTEQLSLTFTQQEDGTLACGLDLSEEADA